MTARALSKCLNVGLLNAAVVRAVVGVDSETGTCDCTGIGNFVRNPNLDMYMRCSRACHSSTTSNVVFLRWCWSFWVSLGLGQGFMGLENYTFRF